jgi:hypothetical protein
MNSHDREASIERRHSPDTTDAGEGAGRKQPQIENPKGHVKGKSMIGFNSKRGHENEAHHQERTEPRHALVLNDAQRLHSLAAKPTHKKNKRTNILCVLLLSALL